MLATTSVGSDITLSGDCDGTAATVTLVNASPFATGAAIGQNCVDDVGATGDTLCTITVTDNGQISGAWS